MHAQVTPGTDVYDAAEDDPGKSRAIESSLWEIESLRNHYCPQVCNCISHLQVENHFMVASEQPSWAIATLPSPLHGA